VQNRIIQQFQERLITGIEASKMLKAEDLLPMDTEVSQGIRDVEPMAMVEMAAAKSQESKKPEKSDK
jgi:hypothetical protein